MPEFHTLLIAESSGFQCTLYFDSYPEVEQAITLYNNIADALENVIIANDYITQNPEVEFASSYLTESWDSYSEAVDEALNFSDQFITYVTGLHDFELYDESVSFPNSNDWSGDEFNP